MNENKENKTPRVNQRRKRFPNKLEVCGVVFQVKYGALQDRHQAHGMSCHHNKWIKIDRDLTRREEESTLLHEIIHMIIRLNLGPEFISEEKEEMLVSCLETHLFTLYQRRGKRNAN